MEHDSLNHLSPPPTIRPKYSIHKHLGSGAVADVLLWKRWTVSAFLLVVSTITWVLFERVGYNILSLIANVLLLLLFILFFWAKSASLLNRPLPPLPNMEVSDDVIEKAAEVAQVWVNKVLGVGHDIALAGDYKLFLEVASSLWFVSLIGNLFNFFTLVYMGVVISMSVPFIYNKYQDIIDNNLRSAHRVMLEQYKKIDEGFLSKIQMNLSKEKKSQ